MMPIQDEASLEVLFARLREVERAHARIARQLDALFAQFWKQSGYRRGKDPMPQQLSPLQETAPDVLRIDRKEQDGKLSQLTARELEVLQLVAQGLTDAEVATRLVLSRRTVNWYLSGIYSKLGVTSRTAATRYVLEQQLFQRNL